MNTPEQRIGIAWYRPEQWALLRALATDPEVLEPTHVEWLVNANKGLQELEQRGIVPVQVDVDVRELAAWCQGRACRLDGSARAAFVADRLREASA
jgi:hypothetical protein